MARLSPYTFSPLDYILPPLYPSNIYTFPCPNHSRDSVYCILKKAFELLLLDQPLLAANLVRDTSPSVRPGTLRLVLDSVAPSKLITRVDHDRKSSPWPRLYTYQWLREHSMPPFALDAVLLSPPTTGMTHSTRAMQAQVNFIDGGCLLNVCIAHTMMDAWGLGLLVESWAAKCRQLQGVSRNPDSFDSPGMEFFESSGALENPPSTEFERLKTKHNLWWAMCLDEKRNSEGRNIFTLPTTLPTVNVPEVRHCVFTFEPEALLRLKALASLSGELPNINVGGALTAFLWRHILRARFPDTAKDETAVISMAINSRNSALRPSIPLSYPGNSVLFGLAQLSLQKLIAPTTPIHEIATLLTNSIDSVRNDGALLQDVIALAASMPDVSAPVIKIQDFLGLHLNSVNWMNMPFANIDFGPIFDGRISTVAWEKVVRMQDTPAVPCPAVGQPESPVSHNGRAEFFRFPAGQFGGICGIFPKRSDGTVEVLIGLKPTDMERLKSDKEFTVWCKDWTLTEWRESKL